MEATAELKSKQKEFFLSGSPCQPHEDDIFTPDNIIKCQKYVLCIQRKLDAAVAAGDKPKMRWYQHLLSKRSRAAKVLAVWRVTKQNQGRYTAGVDQVAISTGSDEEQNQVRHRILNEIDINRKPKPIRRVFIPKPNGKLRPLGIPTLAARVNQEIIRQTIEPICEFHFHDSSYGFRPKRSCQDAMSDLFLKLSQKGSRQWIVDADISGCFDHISHCHIEQTLQKWHVQGNLTKTIHKMLKAKIFYDGQIVDNESGTPQGGVISPLLANVALTALDEYCHSQFGWRKVSPIVRYADDLVLLARTAEEAMFIKDKVKTFLWEKIGLELSDDKTRITHIDGGFDFLGFNFRKYQTRGKKTLLIKPQKSKISDINQKIKDTIRSCRGSSQRVVIEKLNPIIIGWGNYYRHVVSKKVFTDIDHQTYWKLSQWAKRKHPNKTDAWSLRRYFHNENGRNWVFSERQSKKKLVHMSKIPIKRFIKVKNGYRVYDASYNTRKYWEKRSYMNAKNSIHGNGDYTWLFRKQMGQCAYCNTPITAEQIKNVEIHKHHMKPRSCGGKSETSNLRLIHADCHRFIHRLWPREKMSQMMDSKVDYLRLLKPNRNHQH